jgi:hypothetical protein
MAETEWEKLYIEEAETLGKIGALLVRAEMPKIEVRLPRTLAEAAVAAWEREDDDGADSGEESCEQRVVRHRAAALALIGLSVTERGKWDEDGVTVALDPVFIATAVDASDDHSRPACEVPH